MPKAENVAFWNDFFNRDSFETAFRFWVGEMFKPNQDIIFQSGEYSSNSSFQHAKDFDLKKMTVDKGLKFDTSNCSMMSSTFQQSCIGNIPVLDLSSCTMLMLTFYFMQEDTEHNGLYTTKEINLVNVQEYCKFDRAFSYSYYLERLRISGTIGQDGFDTQWSTWLDKESHIQIINALSRTTTSLSVTLSKVAVDKAFETSVGANDGSTSAEWLALVATRSNWTISLS